VYRKWPSGTQEAAKLFADRVPVRLSPSRLTGVILNRVNLADNRGWQARLAFLSQQN